MPELPEVEQVKRSLEEVLPGQVILQVDILYPPLVTPLSPEEFTEKIMGERIERVWRRGKYLLLEMGSYSMAFHLRMTGSLLYGPLDGLLEKHTHLLIRLQGSSWLRFVDMRKFGRILLLEKGEDIATLKGLGPEPLSSSFLLSSFKAILKGRRGKIKSLLLNQSFLAGIGNIYSDEILFWAGIYPGRKAYTLTGEEQERLFGAIQRVLFQGICFGGTSIRNYRDGFGVKGSYQEQLKVYGRKGDECSLCKETLLREKIGGRSSYFCPSCQR